MTALAVAPLLLLAGTSEAGKSSAGVYLDTIGARRVKIRPILLRLRSGVQAVHEGVATREGFDPGEFLTALHDTSRASGDTPLVVESFIDAALAAAVKAAWPTRCAVVFITAPQPLRVRRLATSHRLGLDAAAQIVHDKDRRKRVHEQLDAWRTVTDHWIDNTGTIDDFTARLRRILTQLTTSLN